MRPGLFPVALPTVLTLLLMLPLAAAPVPPIKSPGIVVCEPITHGGTKDLADFGAGCARWLFFEVGGDAQFGQTPLWSDVERAPEELGKSSFALTLPEAAKLTNILGVTHVGVGTIAGTADRCVLSYQIYAVPTKKPLGNPFKAVGSRSQVLALLPGIAQAMAQALGDKKAARPSLKDITPSDMVLVGQVPWGPGEYPSAEQTTALQDLAVRFPLASLLAMNQSLLSDASGFTAAAQKLQAQAPENALVYGQIAYVNPGFLLTGTHFSEIQARFPHNYALAHSAVWLERERPDQKREMVATRLAVRNAPHNPDAWLSLGYTLSHAAQAIRKSRTTNLIPEAEWAELTPLYSEWLSSIQKAVALDPLYGKGWMRLAVAATFQGQQQLANDAFWKALRLDRDHVEVYDWGLEMFQEKWGGDPENLNKVAHLAASEHYTFPGDTLAMGKELGGAGFPDLAKDLLQRALTESRRDVESHPDDAFAHQTLAKVLEQNGLAGDAIPEYQAVTRLMPGDSSAHLALGVALYNSQRWDEAITEYQTAIRLDPRNEQAHVQLGWGYKHQGHYDEAMHELTTASLLSPDDPMPPYDMGVVAEVQNHFSDAVRYFQKAVQLSPYWESARLQLVNDCDSDKQCQVGIAAALEALDIFPRNTAIRVTLADIYLNTHEYEASIAQSRTVLDLDPKDAIAHENLAVALMDEGNQAAARAEWEQVLTLGNDAMCQEARENLAKNP